MEKLRNILAVALVLCLMAGLMPMAAFAADAQFEEIAACAIPLASDASWALVNLIASLLTVLLAMVSLVSLRGKEDGSDEKEICVRLSVVIPAAASVILFILTENVRNPMALIDTRTPAMLLILAGGCMLNLFIARGNRKENGNRG